MLEKERIDYLYEQQEQQEKHGEDSLLDHSWTSFSFDIPMQDSVQQTMTKESSTITVLQDKTTQKKTLERPKSRHGNRANSGGRPKSGHAGSIGRRSKSRITSQRRNILNNPRIATAVPSLLMEEDQHSTGSLHRTSATSEASGTSGASGGSSHVSLDGMESKQTVEDGVVKEMVVKESSGLNHVDSWINPQARVGTASSTMSSFSSFSSSFNFNTTFNSSASSCSLSSKSLGHGEIENVLDSWANASALMQDRQDSASRARSRKRVKVPAASWGWAE